MQLEALAEMTGLQIMRAVAAGELPPPPIALLMDFEPVEVEEGRVVFAGHPAQKHYNPIGSVHGGFAATLLDSALGCAVHTTLAPGVGYTTLDLAVKYVRGMDVDTGRVLCEGTVISSGRRVATAEGRLTRESDGKLLAHGTTTCAVLAP